MFRGDLSNFNLEDLLPWAKRRRQEQQHQRNQQRFHSSSSSTDDESAGGSDTLEHQDAFRPTQLLPEPPPPPQCRVCGGTGHAAGFVGATYIDCCEKACYLCKADGHTTLQCPYRARLSNETGTAPSAYALRLRRVNAGSCTALARRLLRRQLTGRPLQTSELPAPAVAAAAPLCSAAAAPERGWTMAGLVRAHDHRISCLMFHPTRHDVLLSADSGGALAAWNWRAAIDCGSSAADAAAAAVPLVVAAHSAQVNGIDVLRGGSGAADVMVSCGLDGRACVTDLNGGSSSSSTAVLRLNGAASGSAWHSLHAVAAAPAPSCAFYVGDNRGCVYALDLRQNALATRSLLHAPNAKIVSLCFHPRHAALLLTSGNDRRLRVWDLRKLPEAWQARGEGGGGGYVAGGGALPRIASNAVFSPLTGEKVLATCGDNRLRVWPDWCATGLDPARALAHIHSHDFNRYLSPFKAVWDPKDPLERRIVCGRYISEAIHNLPLKPVDVIDAHSGALLAELTDARQPLSCPVTAVHALSDVVCSGGSTKVVVWRWRREAMQQHAGCGAPRPAAAAVTAAAATAAGSLTPQRHGGAMRHDSGAEAAAAEAATHGSPAAAAAASAARVPPALTTAARQKKAVPPALQRVAAAAAAAMGKPPPAKAKASAKALAAAVLPARSSGGGGGGGGSSASPHFATPGKPGKGRIAKAAQGDCATAAAAAGGGGGA
ncbi:WD40-repeat-containing domain protein [Tribonema minus]|uniref:DNA damage-binding protein 2 n=1 Tax=Tribonema minus TaxID=303371 RepID=A0A835YL19_9STRA|nr:WD40-repeat-containing domain protein [Tribonema minus]